MIIILILFILIINLYKLVIYHFKVAKKIKHHYNLEYFVVVVFVVLIVADENHFVYCGCFFHLKSHY